MPSERAPLSSEERRAINSGISALRDRREWWAQFVDDKPGEALPGDPPPSTAAAGRDMADRAIAALSRLLSAPEAAQPQGGDDLARLRAEIAALKQGKWAGRWEENGGSAWGRRTVGPDARWLAEVFIRADGQGHWFADVPYFQTRKQGVCHSPEAARSAADEALRAAGWFLEGDDASPVPASKEQP